VTYEKEMKGLDLVRRDWCVLSKETGTFVVEQILSGNPREEIVQSIHDYLSSLAAKIRSGELGLDAFVITKGLNKNPKDYPDCKGQAHLQVALRMLKADIPVNIGDHIPYVICMQVPLLLYV
jgi:DNA polymerase alpha subunit A